jgi:hypothetical protein
MNTELEQHIADLEHQLREIKEHGLGDSDAALTKWRIERDLKKAEQLLFSVDEIVNKINEQTVLDGETFRVYFREK